MAYTTINKSTDHFNTVLYTGTGSAQSITGVGFRPDWVWGKNRSTTNYHDLEDVVRGATKRISSNATDAEATETVNFTSFDSDGFSVGTGANVNGNGNNIVVWNWLAGGTGVANTDGSVNCTQSLNATAGFSIFKWTGTGSGEVSIGHGLGTAPKMWFVKSLSSGNWFVYTTVIDGSLDYLHLNTTAAKADSSATTATNSVIYGVSNTNQAEDYICYAFKEVQGYSKFGSYIGNANADGTFIYTGFKPAFFLSKRSDATKDWHIIDNKRSTLNPTAKLLYPNLTDAEATPTSCDFLSNGIKLRTANSFLNETGGTYIYMAFAENPLVANVGANGVPATAR